MVKILSFFIITLIMGRESLASESCLQEQRRLRAQVHQLQTRVKQQQITITQLLLEKELQFLDKGQENDAIDLG
ncbi:hypothetical protein NL501_31350, partial [Klebsiella pneumoniae]|nr:hypothetical protein [Klebsiella pneumoniae]